MWVGQGYVAYSETQKDCGTAVIKIVLPSTLHNVAQLQHGNKQSESEQTETCSTEYTKRYFSALAVPLLSTDSHSR